MSEEFLEREYIINKILSGCVTCEFRDEPVLVFEPTPLVKVQAQAIYKREYRIAILEGVPNEKAMLELLQEKGMWDILREGELKTIPERLDTLKLELYNAYFQFRRRDQIRKSIDTLKLREVQLSNEREKFKHASAEGHALSCRNKHLICASTFNLNNEKVFKDDYNKYSQAELELFIQSYIQEKVDDTLIRKISREEPWRSIWSAGKAEGAVFGKPSSLLSNEQKMLIIWSKLYDNIYENPECPPDEVLEDDDCLDGWLILQSKNREKQKKASHGYKPGDKLNKADEVFIMVENQEDIARVQAMNSPDAIFRKQQRMGALQRAGGVLEEQLMPDSKIKVREVAMKQQRQFMEKVRNGK
jgi:hypothetical protein